MHTFAPDYYTLFSCAAGSCTDSCCRAGWLIPLDAETYDFYRKSGIDIDQNSYIDADGDRVFKLRPDRSCVYFTDDGLCELYTKCSRQSEICTKYPRFFEEYDGFTETGLSVSCPTAANLILSCETNPYSALAHVTPDRLLDFLVSARLRAMKLIYNEMSPDTAAAKLLGFGIDLQELIDFNELEYLDSLTFEPAELFTPKEIIHAKRFLLTETEILSERWRELLSADPKDTAGTPLQRRNYLAYLVYRYFLKSVNTEDIAAVCRVIVLLYQLADCLCDDYVEAVRLISKEIEHDIENLEALTDFLT